MNSVIFIHTTLVPQRNVTISFVQHGCRIKNYVKKTRSNTPCFRRTLPVCIQEQRLHMLIYDHLAERE